VVRGRLLDVRMRKTQPATDHKTITSWNALAVSALAHGYQILGDRRYFDAAVAAGTFLRERMLSIDADMVLRVYADGTTHVPGYLDDYSYTANAFIDLWESSADPVWLVTARRMVELLLHHFSAPEGGALYQTAQYHRDLPVRSKPLVDNALPSGNAAAAMALLRLSALCDEPRYQEVAEGIIADAGGGINAAPHGFPAMLMAASFFLTGARRIVVAGEPDRPDTQALLQAVFDRFLPNRTLAVVPPDGYHGDAERLLGTLTQGKRPLDGRATVYVCRDSECQAPFTGPAELVEHLGSG